MVLSQSVEDYLKKIYKLESKSKGASTTQIAESLDISSASATNMLKRLARMGLVDYKSYKGARLTESGQKIALEIIRHHRLLELYLLEVLGYSWDEVHEEAENLEHHISEQFEDKIADLLNHPTHDPHGDPIPTKDGMMPEMKEQSLSQVEERRPYIIVRVKDQEPEPLRYLEKEGLLPGARLTVEEKAPLNGPLTLLIEDKKKVIGRELARTILVSRLSE
ncbi:MAG TPA: metal-dependent transcriptional regulator [Balneolaceae bacterium]|nr:metal-dependent transcriptional regulator [Balneolaceae bacterium]